MESWEFYIINRTSRPVVVKTYGGTDAYGQPLKNLIATRTINASLFLYRHTETDDIRYQDCEYTLLTQDKSLTDKDIIEIDDIDYKVIFFNPYGRLGQAFLKKW